MKAQPQRAVFVTSRWLIDLHPAGTNCCRRRMMEGEGDRSLNTPLEELHVCKQTIWQFEAKPDVAAPQSTASEQPHHSLPSLATPSEIFSPAPEHPGLSRASPPVRTEFCCCSINMYLHPDTALTPKASQQVDRGDHLDHNLGLETPHTLTHRTGVCFSSVCVFSRSFCGSGLHGRQV